MEALPTADDAGAVRFYGCHVVATDGLDCHHFREGVEGKRCHTVTRWSPSIAHLSSRCLLFNDWLLITAWTYICHHPMVGYINVNLCATRTHHIATKPRSVRHFLCYSLQWICLERLFTPLGMNARTCSHNTLHPSFLTHSYESPYGVLTDSNQMVFSMSIPHCWLLLHRMPHWRDRSRILPRCCLPEREPLIVELKGFSFVLQAWLYLFSIAWSSTQKSPEAFPTGYSLMAHIPEFTEKTCGILWKLHANTLDKQVLMKQIFKRLLHWTVFKWMLLFSWRLWIRIQINSIFCVRVCVVCYKHECFLKSSSFFFFFKSRKVFNWLDFGLLRALSIIILMFWLT